MPAYFTAGRMIAADVLVRLRGRDLCGVFDWHFFTALTLDAWNTCKTGVHDPAAAAAAKTLQSQSWLTGTAAKKQPTTSMTPSDPRLPHIPHWLRLQSGADFCCPHALGAYFCSKPP